MAQWIWRFGEFEIYHNSVVHSKRQAYGYHEPSIWKICRPEPVVEFRKRIHTKGGKIQIRACGDFSVALMDVVNERSPQYFGKAEIELPAGEHVLDVRVMNFETFPALYIEGIVETDTSWEVDDMTLDYRPAGAWDVFDSPEKRPDIFPFRYETLKAEIREELPEGGVLFDFGRVTFANVYLSNLKEKKFQIRYGESREEAMSPQWCVTRFSTEPENGKKDFPPYAFRYIYVSDTKADIRAEYEYLPMAQRGEFRCDDVMLNKVWDVAAYTFHLNCREMFLDGIKRDRWVWSADVYQSLFVNRYLFRDEKIEERTLIALGGKAPFLRHINIIMDYTFFWFMSLYEHYKDYGNREFLRQIKPQMDEVMEFCYSRTDSDGFMRGIEGDWIFIDWAEMDKTGAFCAEQILYAAAMEDYSKMCEVLDMSDKGAMVRTEMLRKRIIEEFWDAEKGVFIDSYESGRKYVTRQTNILAYLYLPCSDEQKKSIYENVILNKEIAPITTPYFTFYENQVHCMAGRSDFLEELIRGYYGSMLETGATTLYEQYNPEDTGVEHYAMYGRPFEKSLCHAWSASPIYLFGRFRLGVVNIGIGYDTFDIRPQMGNLDSVSGKVPVPGGYVFVKAEKDRVEVLSDIAGGTLYWKGNVYPIEQGKRMVIEG